MARDGIRMLAAAAVGRERVREGSSWIGKIMFSQFKFGALPLTLSECLPLSIHLVSGGSRAL